MNSVNNLHPDPISPDEYSSSIAFNEKPFTDKQRTLLTSMSRLPEVKDSPYKQYAFLSDGFSLDHDFILKTETGSHAFDEADLAAGLKRHLDGRTLVLPPDTTLADLALDKASLNLTADPMPFDVFLRTLKKDSFQSTTKVEGAAGRPALIEHRHRNSIPGRETRVRMIKLPAAEGKRAVGDSIVIKTADDRILLIDTGNDKAGLARILENIREMHPGHKTEVDVLITHDHSDHVNGLKEMLAQMKKDAAKNDPAKPQAKGKAKAKAGAKEAADTSLLIGRVIFSVHKQDAPVAKKIIEELDALFVKDTAFDSPHLHVYTSKDTAALTRPPAPLRVAATTETVQLLELTGTAGERIELLRLTQPESTNGNSLMLRLTHRGVTQLLAGDLDFKSMRTLVDSGAGLQADILKYPHHVSFPNSMTKAEKGNLAAFLKAVSPRRIQFSNFGSGMTETTEINLRKFINDTLGDDIIFDTTNDLKDAAPLIKGTHHETIVDAAAPPDTVPAASAMEITFIIGTRP